MGLLPLEAMEAGLALTKPSPRSIPELHFDKALSFKSALQLNHSHPGLGTGLGGFTA